MAHKVIILYRLYMPYYFLGTFTEYPFFVCHVFGTKMAYVGIVSDSRHTPFFYC